MDKTGTELARANLQLFSKEMSPEYQQVRNLLLGHLAAHGATVEQLKQQEINDRRNVYLVMNFAHLLPVAKTHQKKWEFTTDDPMLAKTLHSHVVWIETKVGMDEQEKKEYDRRRGETTTSDYRADGKNSRYYARRPYAIVGKGVIDGRHTWLLVGLGDNPLNKQGTGYLGVASCQQGEPFLFEPNRKSRRAITQLEDIARSEFPSPDDMKDIFDLDRHTLIVSGASPKTVEVKPKYYVYQRPQKRISDVELGLLEVNSHMDRLATELEITAQLDKLLEEHA